MKPALINQVQTRLPTRHGNFILHYYSNNLDHKEHVALVKGDVRDQEAVLARVHSECFTGDVLGSRRCDCGEQLDQALTMIEQAGCGILLYLRQEGRGIGLLQKLKAYNLQDQGMDTVDANLHLGHRADERDYTLAALILQDLGVKSIALITNNPSKIDSLVAMGIHVTERIAIEPDYHADNEHYLRAKASKMRHILNLPDADTP
ncbi:MAG: GTP cyclohydrolase II [Methylococcales bacterium]|nr:GTP cyclohydrolase II [Methylococcales bacterium]